MEPSRSFTNFTQLRNALDNSVAHQDVQRSSEQGERLSVAESQGNTYHQQYLSNQMNRRSMRMDELVQVYIHGCHNGSQLETTFRL